MIFNKKINKNKEYSKEEIKRWRDEEVYPLLKEYNLLPETKESVNIAKPNISFIIVAIILGSILAGIAIYGFESDSFKSSVNQNVTLEPLINNTLNNEYIFNPETQNQYKFTMPNITVNCPDLICDCGA